MITEDSLATAQIAQLFGSELLKVQTSARTDSGSQPDIVRLDPKQFLLNSSNNQNYIKTEENRIIQMLQREAESAYPRNADETSPMVSFPSSPEAAQVNNNGISLQIPKPGPTNIQIPESNYWLSIANSLERIANRLDSINITIQKRKVTRVKK